MPAKWRLQRCVAAGLLAVTACDGQDATATTETSSPAPAAEAFGCLDTAVGPTKALGATLTADVTPTGNGIQVRYEVVNGGDSALYVVHSLVHPAFTMNYTQQNYYLTPGSDGVVEVAQREYFPPESCELPLYYVPPPPALAARVEPGQRIGATFAVDRPLQVRNPYGDDVLTQLPPMPDPASRFRFCVGVAATARQLTASVFPKDRDYYRFSRGEQQFLCSDVANV